MTEKSRDVIEEQIEGMRQKKIRKNGDRGEVYSFGTTVTKVRWGLDLGVTLLLGESGVEKSTAI